MLEDDIIRLRSQNGSRYRDKTKEMAELGSEIGDLERRKRVRFAI
jgi:hypothetical protein